MTSLLRKALKTLSECWDDILVARYIDSVCEYARQESMLPLTVPTLARGPDLIVFSMYAD